MKINLRKIIETSIDAKTKMLNVNLEAIDNACKLMLGSVNGGNKILWCGNGGSAADSQHMSAELMGGLRSHTRDPIPSIALSTDSSFLTAWSNDTSFDYIFSRQIEGIGLPGDILVAISTSGNSTNVLNAIKTAQNKDIKSVVLTGKSQGKMKGMGDVMISVPTDDTQRIQECHLLVEHILCEYLEEEYKK